MLNSKIMKKIKIKIKPPFIIYADFRSVLVPEDHGKQNPKESYAKSFEKNILVGVMAIN